MIILRLMDRVVQFTIRCAHFPQRVHGNLRGFAILVVIIDMHQGVLKSNQNQWKNNRLKHITYQQLWFAVNFIFVLQTFYSILVDYSCFISLFRRFLTFLGSVFNVS